MNPIRWRFPSIVANFILAATLLAIWINFAPVGVGGKTSYVIVNGISMEPNFHFGDLTILHKAESYQIGDIVTYHDARMAAYVIHRIIGIEQDHFILKGDNNSWVDAYYPTQDEIIGKLWIYIPKLGNIFKWLRGPLHMALSMGLLGGIFMSGMIIQPSKKGKQKRASSGSTGGMLEGGLYIFGFFTLLFLALSILSFLRPLMRPADKIKYTQQSQFSYSATGTPVLYDTDVIRPGEPIFPKLTCFLNAGLTYTLAGQNWQTVSGSYQWIARVSDEQTGWQRTLPLSGVTTFNSSSFYTTSALDLCQVVGLANTFEQETGLRSSTYTLEIIPQITVNASFVGNQIADVFEPMLVFKFDDLHFSLITPKGQDDPLHVAKQGFAPNPNSEVNTLSIFGSRPTIRSIRVVAVLVFFFSLSGLLILAIRVFLSSEETLIRLKYDTLLVQVSDQNIEIYSSLVNVASIEELAKLAERHNTAILHLMSNSTHSYLVQCNRVTYRYVSKVNKTYTPEIQPAYSEVNKPEDHSNSTPAIPLNENDLFGYALNKNKVAKPEVEETVVLKKIRL